MNTKKERYWFHAKEYGWGWTPASIEGWLILFGYVAAILFLYFRIDPGMEKSRDTLALFIPGVAALTGLLFFICYQRGQKPEWRWGKKKHSEHSDHSK
jgi:hypothetical protein